MVSTLRLAVPVSIAVCDARQFCNWRFWRPNHIFGFSIGEISMSNRADNNTFEATAPGYESAPHRPEQAAELRSRVISFLFGRNLPGLRQVQVDVDGHAVTLRGRVRSFYEKQLASHCCRRVAGVHQVIDDLHVDAIAR